MNELKVGSTVYVEGEEYVVVFYRKTKDYSGSSIELHARDPILAHNIREECESKRKLLEKTNKLLGE